MKLTTVATVLLLGVSLVSCNENEKPKADTQPRGKFLDSLQQGQTTYSPNLAGNQVQGMGAQRELSLPGANLSPLPDQANLPKEPAIQIPDGARWTLYCASVSGPDRFGRMAQLKAYVTANLPLKDWYVVHDEQTSTLFYGFYAAVEKSEPGSARAQADRNVISEWREKGKEDRPFATAFFTPITPPNPVAPAEWLLSNAGGAYWSVQIAAFKDNPQRKQAAVEAVKEMRAKGIPAYYHHGQAVSSVCIGTWPKEALKSQDMDGSRAVVDEDQTMMVTDMPLPAKYQNAKLTTKDGQRLVPFAQRIEIADQSLKATLEQYRYHYVNYEAQARQVQTVSGKVEKVIVPSFLVKVPNADSPGTAAAGGDGAGGERSLLSPGRMPPPPPTSTQQPAGGGRLRGYGN